MKILSATEIRKVLTTGRCFETVRGAMVALSEGGTIQELRSIMPLGPARVFGLMPGALSVDGIFGAKLVSVSLATDADRSRHQGVVVLFDGTSGAPFCVADAEEITTLRTAAASAVATDALARADAKRLALLGSGTQALAHVRAIASVRSLEAVTIWGRNADRAAAFADVLRNEMDIAIDVMPDVEATVEHADIICTLTGARDPILRGTAVTRGAHVNAVGSSTSASAEIDEDLVARSRFVADYAPGIRAQGGEWQRALAAGRVTENHLVGEIGDVLTGLIRGRENDEQITVYKSIGHIVQDLASAFAAYQAVERGEARSV